MGPRIREDTGGDGMTVVGRAAVTGASNWDMMGGNLEGRHDSTRHLHDSILPRLR